MALFDGCESRRFGSARFKQKLVELSLIMEMIAACSASKVIPASFVARNSNENSARRQSNEHIHVRLDVRCLHSGRLASQLARS